MITEINYIGLFDRQGNIHGVSLHKGVNLITGKSSTGKSAVIEIFDYIMGASEKTIPQGVITANALLYFVIITIAEKKYFIGREQENQRNHYLIDGSEMDSDIKKISLDKIMERVCKDEDFKVQIGLILGLDMEDTQDHEQQEDFEKSMPRPSVRNMMSYILQHQNLIANKQALFYRFDNPQKREQVIDQFKIFAGFVDSGFYPLMREISILNNQLSELKRRQTAIAEKKEQILEKIGRVLKDYHIITGHHMCDYMSVAAVESNPSKFKEQLQNFRLEDIVVDVEAKSYEKEYNQLINTRTKLQGDLRLLHTKGAEYVSTINEVKEYRKSLIQHRKFPDVEMHYSICPFCGHHSNLTTNAVNRLENAIQHLNEEIRKTPLLVRSFEQDLLDVKTKYDDVLANLKTTEKEIERVEKIIKETRRNRSISEQAAKKILEMETLIDFLIDNKDDELEDEIQQTSNLLYEKEVIKKEQYDVEGKMNEAERSINRWINSYREYLPLEKDTYKEYDFHFSLSDFQLCLVHKDNQFKKISIRAVGSGANWLNAHLCLFMALSSYFVSNPKSLIPSLLFIDQPSQVYFPVKDDSETFDFADQIRRKTGNNDSDGSNDFENVCNIYTQLYQFTKGLDYKVQIIVTDHADKLNIDGLTPEEFETNIISARWRKPGEGFIMGIKDCKSNPNNMLL